MDKEEILKKAIAIAVENGYKFPFESTQIYNDGRLIAIEDGVSVEGMIFSHEFAQAFWGETEYMKQESSIEDGFPVNTLSELACDFHRQQMVLEEDPVKYLEQFLKTAKG